MKSAAPFWDAAAAMPPYIRIESSLLRVFPGYPKVTPPASAATRGKRIYQLRQYQSPTNMDHVRKVEMFHHGEFGIFAKAGATGVFYADALVGPNLPNLTYMLSFPDLASDARQIGKSFPPIPIGSSSLPIRSSTWTRPRYQT